MAAAAFASQAEMQGYLERDLIESAASYWSRFGDGRHAEAFEVVRNAAAGSQGESAAGRVPVARRAESGAGAPSFRQ
jgi:hypothetical protein